MLILDQVLCSLSERTRLYTPTFRGRRRRCPSWKKATLTVPTGLWTSVTYGERGDAEIDPQVWRERVSFFT